MSNEGIVYRLGNWKIESDLFSKEKIWTHTSGFKCKCWDADFSDTLFVAAVQPEGFERYTVEIYSMDINTHRKPRHLKSIPHAGPQVAILDGEVYFLKSEKDLRYSSVCNLK